MNSFHPASLQAFLRTARWPALPEALPTFFSIAGIERRELPLSNTYAFFFRSDEPHGLGTLFTEALFDVLALEKRGSSFVRPTLPGPVRVAREYPMLHGQWLDLLLHDGPADRSLHGATFGLLIENKVNHWLANDLDNYWQSIPALAHKTGIVLGLQPESLPSPWVYVSHQELAQAVEARLGKAIHRVNPRYLPVLLHFLDYLNQMSGTHSDAFTQAFNFAQRNRAQLAAAQQLLNQVTAEGLASAVTEAFGPNYQKRGVFENRLDIQHLADRDFRYVVYYGHILELAESPSYTICLYSGWDEAQPAEWRKYLSGLAGFQAAHIEHLSWFPYDGLLVGKTYEFTGSTLDDLKAEIAKVLQDDWRPLEPLWLTKRTVPTV